MYLMRFGVFEQLFDNIEILFIESGLMDSIFCILISEKNRSSIPEGQEWKRDAKCLQAATRLVVCRNKEKGRGKDHEGVYSGERLYGIC